MVAGAHDVLVHRLSRPATRTAVRFTAAVALVGIARAVGVSTAELGLGRSELGSGIRTGAAAAAAAAAGVFTAAALPATRPFFLDKRAPAGGRGDVAAELARITFVAVPPEELTYRSALLGLWLGRPRTSAVAWSSALFGLSHMLPTLATMNQTALHRQLSQRPLRQAGFIAGNVAVTTAAGAAFGWLRLRSGSVVAPLLAHAALNDAALVAGRVAHGLRRQRLRRAGINSAGRPSSAGPAGSALVTSGHPARPKRVVCSGACGGRKPDAAHDQPGSGHARYKGLWAHSHDVSPRGIIDASPSAAFIFAREGFEAGLAGVQGWPPPGG